MTGAKSSVLCLPGSAHNDVTRPFKQRLAQRWSLRPVAFVPHPGAIIAVRRQSQTIFVKVGLF